MAARLIADLGELAAIGKGDLLVPALRLHCVGNAG
jgi:hypothetical protein